MQPVTEDPVVGRVACPSGDGNRARNLQIAEGEIGSPDHSAIPVPNFSCQSGSTDICFYLIWETSKLTNLVK